MENDFILKVQISVSADIMTGEFINEPYRKTVYDMRDKILKELDDYSINYVVTAFYDYNSNTYTDLKIIAPNKELSDEIRAIVNKCLFSNTSI